MLTWLLLDAIICGVVGAIITSARGAGALIGALVGAVFGPLGVIASFAFSGPGGSGHTPAVPATAPSSSDASYRDCPFCAESIRKAAVKCRYCGSDVQPIVEEAIEPQPAAPYHDVAPGLSPDADQGDRVIIMLVLALALILGLLWVAGAAF